MSLDVDNKISLEQYRREVGQDPLAPKPASQATSKWRNKPTWYSSPTVGLRRYDSKKEANRARELDLLVLGGKIIAWWSQWPIYCGFDDQKGSPARMFPDFRILWADGTVTFEDTKGAKPTEAWKLRWNAVRTCHGIEVKVI